MANKLVIKRKPGNVRFGSMKWAQSRADYVWTWETGRTNAGDAFVFIRCAPTLGDATPMTVAVFPYTAEGVPYSSRLNSIAHGGAPIGEKLFCALEAFVRNLDLAADDAQKIQITGLSR